MLQNRSLSLSRDGQIMQINVQFFFSSPVFFNDLIVFRGFFSLPFLCLVYFLISFEQLIDDDWSFWRQRDDNLLKIATD